MKIKLLLAVFFFFVSSAVFAATATLTIHTSKLRNNKGDIKCAVWNNSKGFPGHYENAAYKKIVPIQKNKAKIVFKNIPYGEYAISILHDEDNDGKMSSNFFGIPQEGYGVSTNILQSFGPPPYNKAIFKIAEPEKNVTISIIYL